MGGKGQREEQRSVTCCIEASLDNQVYIKTGFSFFARPYRYVRRKRLDDPALVSLSALFTLRAHMYN